MITCLFVGAGVGFKEVRDFMNKHVWLYIVTIVITIGIMVMLICFYNIFKKVPYNYILLFVFVICESYSVAIITSYYSPISVLIAACITLAMTFTLSLYACFTKNDFTTWYKGVFWALLGALIASILFTIFYPNRYVLIIISFVIVVILSIGILVDTQLILGGGRYQLSYDDYILAVLILFTDIIAMFVEILSLFGERR